MKLKSEGRNLKNSLFVFPLLASLVSFSSCHLGKVFRYNIIGVDDYKIFSNRTIAPATKKFDFAIAPKNNLGERIQIKADCSPSSGSLDYFIDQSPTLALLIIRNDTILYEKYSKGYTRESYVTTGSLVKSIINLMIGIAVNEGKIKSINDLVIDYLPEMKGRPGFDKLRIESLLNMTSGLKESKNLALPTSSEFKYYYGSNLNRYVRKQKVTDFSGQNFYSHTVTTQLLNTILERVTGKTPSQYLEEKIWAKMGAEYDALWSLDKPEGTEKGFCCFNARPIDFARLGKLVLDRGKTETEQVLPAEWLNRLYNPDTTLPHIIKSKLETPKDDYYFHNFWIDPTESTPRFIKMAGIYGQKLVIFPKEHLIITTFSDRNGLKIRCQEEDIFYQIANQIKSSE